MANDGNVQQAEDVEILFHYSEKSSITDLVLGVESIKNIRDNPELTRVIDDLLHRLNIKINISDRKGILEFLRDLAKVSPEKLVEEIDIKKDVVEEKNEVREEPESKLTLDKIEMLVEEYETANEKRQSEISGEIKTILDRYKNIKGSEVDRLLNRLRELKKNGILETKLENVIEDKLKTEIPEIEVKKNIVEQFADEMAKKDGHNTQEQEEIRRIVLEKIRGGEIRSNKIINELEVRKIELETEKFIRDKKNKVEVENDRVKRIKEAFNLAAENAATEAERRQVLDYGEEVAEFYQTPTPNLILEKTNAENELKEKIPSLGKREDAFDKTEGVVKALYNNDLKGVIDRAKGFNFNKNLISGIREGRAFEAMVDMVNKNPEIIHWIDMTKAKIKMVEGVGKFVSKWVPGGETLVGKITESIGGVAIKEFLVGSMKVMAEQGMITGAKAIMSGIAGIKAGGDIAALSGGSEALMATLASFVDIPVVGWIILAVVAIVVVGAWLIDKVIKLYDKLSDWIHRNTGINLSAVKNFVADNLHLGKFVGSMAQFGFNAMMFGGAIIMGGMAMLFGPILTIGLASMTALIAPVVIGLAGGMMAYNLLIQSPMIASMVPPPPMATGGTCWPKGSEEESGKINCNQDAPKNETGIDKDNFVKHLAADWHTGKNYSGECFDDTVNRALCAKINPQFALWAWLHESGASNYDIADVEDFGIHGSQSVPAKNFDLQIKAFLKLDPGRACKDLDYWTSLATNYLTGGCDPNKEIPQSDGTVMTGYKYLEEIKLQWGWIKETDFPANIHDMGDYKGGSQCDGSKTDRPDNEYTRPDGVVMVCDAPVDENGNFIGQPGGGTDPDAGGIAGEPAPGDACSVGMSVASIKQCGQSWSNIGLPGGSGTICSAGCGPSSVSSILTPINRGMTPKTVIFQDGSPYANMTGDGSSLGQAKISLEKNKSGDIGEVGEVQKCGEDTIGNWIRQGKAVIFLANSYTGSGGGFIGHILVAIGVDNAGVIYTRDPYYSNESPFPRDGEGKEAGQIKDLLECLPVQLKLDKPCQ